MSLIYSNMEHYRKVVSLLKRKCPAKYPVHVRRVTLSRHKDGDCQFKDDKFLIRINRELEEYMAIEVFLHELAHVLSWDENKDAHHKGWGVAFSRVYRIFLKEFLDKI